jgi:hypothetical protein
VAIIRPRVPSRRTTRRLRGAAGLVFNPRFLFSGEKPK